MRYFTLYSEANPIKSFNIMYSLASLLFCSHKVDAFQVFELAKYISTKFDFKPFDNIEKAVIDMTPESIAGDLKKKKSLL